MKETDLIFGIMASLNKKEYSFEVLSGLVSPFSINESSLRTALSRMNQRELINIRHDGKKAFYLFGDKGLNISKNVSYGFRSPDWSEWNNSWNAVVFSVPDSPTRHSIRKKLESYRYAAFFPGFWIRPFHPSESMSASFAKQISGGHVSLMVCSGITGLTKEKVSEIWSLDETGRKLTRAFDFLSSRIKSIPLLSPQEAFIERFLTGNEIVQTLFKDPLLPPVLLPGDWNGFHLRKLFQEWDAEIRYRSEIFVKNVLKYGGGYEKEN
jgi:phenylacetic acid degradation operon negative regulatory protein